jgi:hypothetical protein
MMRASGSFETPANKQPVCTASHSTSQHSEFQFSRRNNLRRCGGAGTTAGATAASNSEFGGKKTLSSTINGCGWPTSPVALNVPSAVSEQDRPGGPQGRSRRFGENKILLSLTRTEHGIVQLAAQSPYRLRYMDTFVLILDTMAVAGTEPKHHWIHTWLCSIQNENAKRTEHVTDGLHAAPCSKCNSPLPVLILALHNAVLQHTDWLQALCKLQHFSKDFAIHTTQKLTAAPPSDALLMPFHVLGPSLRTCEFATLCNISQHGGV